MSDIVFPFLCEEYTLNEHTYVKFTHIESNKYGFSLYNDDGIYILLFDDLQKFLIIKTNIYEYCYYYDIKENILYCINQFNQKSDIQNNDHRISYLFDKVLTYTNNIIIINKNMLYEYNIYVSEIDKTPIDLTQIIQVIDELNEIVYLQCLNKYKFELNYAYKMNNVIFFAEEYPNSLILCIKIDNKCVSSIEYILEIDNNIYNLKIDSKTHKKYEGNKFNQILRLITMLIAPYFPVKISYIHSYAINKISAYLMIKLFKNNDYDELFDNYLQHFTNTYEILDIVKDYMDGIDPNTKTQSIFRTEPEIQIYSPVDEVNITDSKKNLYELIKNLPCEIDFIEIMKSLDPNFTPQDFIHDELQQYFNQPQINQQIGGYIKKKCKKYKYKIKQKNSNIYIDKLLYWNSLYMYYEYS